MQLKLFSPILKSHLSWNASSVISISGLSRDQHAPLAGLDFGRHRLAPGVIATSSPSTLIDAAPRAIRTGNTSGPAALLALSGRA